MGSSIGSTLGGMSTSMRETHLRISQLGDGDDNPEEIQGKVKKIVE